MNFLLIIFLALGLVISFLEFEMKYFNGFASGFLVLFGITGGLNYVLFGKFTLWNKKEIND